MMRLAMLLLVSLALAACSESNPTGPSVHCFDQATQLNANVPTGKIQVTCPNVT